MSPSFFKKLGPVKIDKIKSFINCEILNIKNNDEFNDLVSINNVDNNSLTFLYDNEIVRRTLPFGSGLICSSKSAKEFDSNQKILIVKNVQEAVAKISNIFYRELNEHEKNQLPKPVLGKNCEIDSSVKIENGVVVGDNTKINQNTVIKHSCIIGKNTKIGSNTTISNSILGDDIYVGSNSSIGQRGFGFYMNNINNLDIYHSGRVIIRSNASIGSGCTIDRGSFSDTIIGENSYLDNLCHIAHNVEVGNNCAFAAMTGIAGSAKIGNNVLTGGQAGIAGHVKIGNNVRIAAKSGVFNSLKDGESVMGNPAINTYTFIKKYKKTYGKR